jgi:hypothetical protein
MSDYTSNFSELLTGHLGLGGSNSSSAAQSQGRNSINDTLDIQDALNHVIAGGYTDFSDQDVKSNYKYISSLVGAQKAEKLFVQAFSFNMKPGNNKKGGEDKIQEFYDTGSKDPETQQTLTAITKQGYGVRDRFRNSAHEGVRLLSGADAKPDKDLSSKDMVTIQSTINKKTSQ